MWTLFSACAPADTHTAAEVRPAEVAVATVHAVVAAADLLPGAVLTASDLRIEPVPAFLPHLVELPDAVFKHTVREPMYAGEPVRLERLVAPEGDRTGFSVLASPGHTAQSIPVPAFAAVGLQPGCQVDVLRAEVSMRRPSRALPRPADVLGTVAGSKGTELVLAVAGSPVVTGPVTVVMLPASERPRLRDNPEISPFEGGLRPQGDAVTLARHLLLPGNLIRSVDLTEVAGPPHNGLRFKHIWAQVPHLTVYPGEIVREERLIHGGTGLCWRIPDGLRGVTIPAHPGTVSLDWVEGYVSIDVAGNGIEHLYVVDVMPDAALVTLATSPDTAWAIAVAATALGPFSISADR